MDKNSWFSFLTKLHNITRNGQGIKLTGLPALNEINNFLVLMFLENKIDSYELPKYCKFTYLYDEFCTDVKIKEDENQSSQGNKNCYKLWEKYCDIRKPECVIRLFANHNHIKKYIKNHVNTICAYTEKQEAGINIQKIINEMYKKFDSIAKFYNKKITELTLDDWDFDAFGLAYEQWKSESVGEGGKTTEQHFTPLELKQYIINELKIKDNEIFYEPACGTGGFITTAYKSIKETKQDLEKFKNNVYANECEPEIYKPLLVNMLIHEMPIENICFTDSLDINNCNKMKNKVDVCGANPPFGGGADINWSDYWGPLKAGKKKVIKKYIAQFIIHMYHSLKNKGRLGTVMDRTILNNGYDQKNGWENRYRKWLVENVNITKIVIIEKGTFPYTNIATAILFGIKGEKTKEIKYYNGKLKDPKSKSGFYVEDEPFEIRKYDDIVKNNYNLKVDKDEEAEVVDENIKYVKLGDVLISDNSGEIISKEYFNKGNKILWSCSNESIFTNYDNFPEKKLTNETDLILPRNGSQIPLVKIPSKNNLYTNVVQRIIINKTIINNKFLYYYLNLTVYDFILNISNSIPSYNMDVWKNRKIPKITLIHQEEIVKLLDEQFTKYNIQKLIDYPNSNKLFKLLIYKKYDDFLDAMHLIYRKIEADTMHLTFEKDKKAIFNWLVKKENCESKKLGDILEKKSGKSLPKDKMIVGEYPVIGGGEKLSGYHNEYNYDKKFIFIARVGSAGHISKYNGKCYVTDLVGAFIVKNILYDYAYYYLKYNENSIKNVSEKNAAPNINFNILLNNFYIQIPSKQKQQEIVDQIESINKHQETYKQYGDMLEKQITQIFETIDSIVLDITNNNENLEEESEDDIESDEETNENKIIA